MAITALHAWPVLLSLVAGQTSPAEKPRPRDHADGSSRSLQMTDQQVDQVIDRFILSDIGQIRGRAALLAQQEFNRLDVQAVPALVRGLNRAANIRASCPIQVLSAKLNGLASFVEDPAVLDFVLKTIGQDVTRPYHRGILETVRGNFRRRRAALAEGKLRARDDVARRLFAQDAEAARKALKDDRPDYRWAAARVAASKGLAVEGELVELLTDADREVRQEARVALVRLGRGVDCGPDPNPSEDDWSAAARRWRDWLEVRRVAAELPAASAERQNVLIVRLRDGKGAAFTQALADAIPRLGEAVQPQARAALRERLLRMTAKTLRAKLDDESREVRLAALAACVAKKATEVVPDLIPLLDDPDPEMALGSHAALRRLTGKDFGPGRDVTRANAIRAWRDWWGSQGG